MRRGTLFTVLLVFAAARVAQANGSTTRPVVTGPVELTLVLVPEKEACAGGSYLEDGSCSPVAYEDAGQWAEQHPHFSVSLEPGPQAIKLTPAFFEKLRLLVDYDSFPPPDLDGRWSVVLIFDTGDHLSTTAVLKRRGNDGLAEATTRMPIGDGGHALTHQRADAFKPARSVVWVLSLDSNVYRFWVTKP